LVGKHEGKRLLGRLCDKLECNTKVSYMERVRVYVDSVYLAQITEIGGLFQTGQVSLEFCRMWAISSSVEVLSVFSQDALSSMALVIFFIVFQRRL
jgi:hypothetical protein